MGRVGLSVFAACPFLKSTNQDNSAALTLAILVLSLWLPQLLWSADLNCWSTPLNNYCVNSRSHTCISRSTVSCFIYASSLVAHTSLDGLIASNHIQIAQHTPSCRCCLLQQLLPSPRRPVCALKTLTLLALPVQPFAINANFFDRKVPLNEI